VTLMMVQQILRAVVADAGALAVVQREAQVVPSGHVDVSSDAIH
jgi:hypothetical protein